MQASYLVQVFLRHTGDPCISRMGHQGHSGLFEPVVQSLGMNAKQTSAVCDKKKRHTENSCARKVLRQTAHAQISRNSGTSRKFLGYLGIACCAVKNKARSSASSSQPGSAVQADGARETTVSGSTISRVGNAEGPGGDVEHRSVAQIPVKKARATSTSVMCLYQPMKLRTS